MKILVWLVCFLLNSLNANQIVAKQNKTDRQLILIEVAKNEPKDGKYQVVGPFISNSYAIALVMYKEGAGQIILKKESKTWKIIGGEGGAYDEQALVNNFNIPKKDAESMIDQSARYWKNGRK